MASGLMDYVQTGSYDDVRSYLLEKSFTSEELLEASKEALRTYNYDSVWEFFDHGVDLCSFWPHQPNPTDNPNQQGIHDLLWNFKGPFDGKLLRLIELDDFDCVRSYASKSRYSPANYTSIIAKYAGKYGSLKIVKELSSCYISLAFAFAILHDRVEVIEYCLTRPFIGRSNHLATAVGRKGDNRILKYWLNNVHNHLPEHYKSLIYGAGASGSMVQVDAVISELKLRSIPVSYLHLASGAASQGHSEIFWRTLKVNPTKSGEFLFIAAGGNLKLVKEIVEDGHAKHLYYPIIVAIRKGRIDILQYLLDRGSFTEADLNMFMWNAEAYERQDIIKLLVDM